MWSAGGFAGGPYEANVMTKRKMQTKSKRAKRSATATNRAGSSKPPAQSKAAACLTLLSRKEGASVTDLQKATGWQPHSVRGFLSAKIKAAGLKLTSEKSPDGERRYHVKSA